VTGITNRDLVQADQSVRERTVHMLLSSILQILDRTQTQRQSIESMKIEPFEIEMASAAEKLSSVQEIESEIDPVAELPMPFVHQPEPKVSMQGLEELIRAVTKFEKPEQRVVDVFE
jgi:hypothetical protein